MDTIKRVLMQINQTNRDRNSDQENQIMQLQCYLSIEALKISEMMGDPKILKEIMKTIEETCILKEEYLFLKGEIIIKANEWKEATIAFNRMKESANE
jgi:hypothetical protein